MGAQFEVLTLKSNGCPGIAIHTPLTKSHHRSLEADLWGEDGSQVARSPECCCCVSSSKQWYPRFFTGKLKRLMCNCDLCFSFWRRIFGPKSGQIDPPSTACYVSGTTEAHNSGQLQATFFLLQYLSCLMFSAMFVTHLLASAMLPSLNTPFIEQTNKMILLRAIKIKINKSSFSRKGLTSK